MAGAPCSTRRGDRPTRSVRSISPGFGGKLPQFAAAWTGLALIVVMVSLMLVESPISFYDDKRTGFVDSIRETNARSNDRPIYAVDYHFTDERGVQRTGTSYTTDPPRYPHPTVIVELERDAPWRSRAVGMKARVWALPWYLIPAFGVFVIIGLLMWRRHLRAAREALHLLRHGRPTRGKLLGKKPTRLTYQDPSGEYPEFEVELEFTDERDRVHQVRVRTLHPELLEDDALEPIVYDPMAPSRATTLDHLPGSPSIRPDGSLAARPGFAYHLALLPALCAVGLVGSIVVIAVRIIT